MGTQPGELEKVWGVIGGATVRAQIPGSQGGVLKPRAIPFPGTHKEQALEKAGGEGCGALPREVGTEAIKGINSQHHTAWDQTLTTPLERFVTLGITSL